MMGTIRTHHSCADCIDDAENFFHSHAKLVPIFWIGLTPAMNVIKNRIQCLYTFLCHIVIFVFHILASKAAVFASACSCL